MLYPQGFPILAWLFPKLCVASFISSILLWLVSLLKYRSFVPGCGPLTMLSTLQFLPHFTQFPPTSITLCITPPTLQTQCMIPSTSSNSRIRSTTSSVSCTTPPTPCIAYIHFGYFTVTFYYSSHILYNSIPRPPPARQSSSTTPSTLSKSRCTNTCGYP